MTKLLEQYLATSPDLSKYPTVTSLVLQLGHYSGVRIIQEYLLGKGYDKYSTNERVVRIAKVCNNEFTGIPSVMKDKVTCGYQCSNTYFRSGPDNPNWKQDSYRTTCFHYHSKECVICGESNIVEVHHLDENHSNNQPENLIPLCPTHHQYWHSIWQSRKYSSIGNKQQRLGGKVSHWSHKPVEVGSIPTCATKLVPSTFPAWHQQVVHRPQRVDIGSRNV